MRVTWQLLARERGPQPFLLCPFRYKSSGEVRTLHENPPRLRAHGVQRCVHLPYVLLILHCGCCCCCMVDHRLTSWPWGDADPLTFSPVLCCSCGLLWWVMLSGSLGSVCMGWVSTAASRVLGSTSHSGLGRHISLILFKVVTEK